MLFFKIAALCGGLSVAFGAFGAHGLKDKLSPEMLAVFQTGVTYQMWHALALLFCAFLLQQKIISSTVPAWLFVVGIILFSGSLYILALSGVKQWGMVTPLGGLSFLLGWTVLFLSFKH